jgi:hypothetical protein
MKECRSGAGKGTLNYFFFDSGNNKETGEAPEMELLGSIEEGTSRFAFRVHGP